MKTVYHEGADDFLTFEGRLFASSIFPQTVLWVLIRTSPPTARRPPAVPYGRSSPKARTRS